MSNPSFHKHSTADEVAAFHADQIKGKNVVITGATGGLVSQSTLPEASLVAKLNS